MTTHSFRIPILGLSIWSQDAVPLAEGRAELDEVLDMACGTPDLAYMDPLVRRRLSPMARGMLHCAERASRGQVAGRMVFASRHGEVTRTIPILEDLAQGIEPSPTLFSMNVHNAVSGIWSIVKGNRGPTTALAAGPETFGWGLLDALAAYEADPTMPVLYIFGEDRLPEVFSTFDEPEAFLHAVALLIGLPARRHLVLEWEAGDQDDPRPQSLLFIQAVAGSGPGVPWSRHGRVWRWHVD